MKMRPHFKVEIWFNVAVGLTCVLLAVATPFLVAMPNEDHDRGEEMQPKSHEAGIEWQPAAQARSIAFCPSADTGITIISGGKVRMFIADTLPLPQMANVGCTAETLGASIKLPAQDYGLLCLPRDLGFRWVSEAELRVCDWTNEGRRRLNPDSGRVEMCIYHGAAGDPSFSWVGL